VKELYDQGKVAIIQGIGYPNSNRSHFPCMDIWHTCEPTKLVPRGWLGKAIRDLDPHHENVLTGVSLAVGLPRANGGPRRAVTSVGDLDTYGVMTGISDVQQRQEALTLF